MDILLWLLAVTVVPIVINKSTERGYFAFIHPYLREIWMVLLVIFTLYLLEKPAMVEFAMKHKDGWVGYVVVFMVGGLLLCCYWAVTGWALQAPAQALGVGDPFKLTDKPTGFINLNNSLADQGSSPLWVTYTSSFGDTASPVAVALYVEITNQTDFQQRIKSYSVAIHTETEGWIYLSPIPLRSVRVWMPIGGLQKAALFDFTLNGLDYILEKPIAPHDTVAGWWFFDSKVQGNTPSGSLIRYRISLTTFSGIKYELETSDARVSSDRVNPGNTEGTTVGPTFAIPPGKPTLDISGFHRKLYSQPVN